MNISGLEHWLVSYFYCFNPSWCVLSRSKSIALDVEIRDKQWWGLSSPPFLFLSIYLLYLFSFNLFLHHCLCLMVFENFYFLAVVFFGFKVSNGDLLVFIWLYVLQTIRLKSCQSFRSNFFFIPVDMLQQSFIMTRLITLLISSINRVQTLSFCIYPLWIINIMSYFFIVLEIYDLWPMGLPSLIKILITTPKTFIFMDEFSLSWLCFRGNYQNVDHNGFHWLLYYVKNPSSFDLPKEYCLQVVKKYLTNHIIYFKLF